MSTFETRPTDDPREPLRRALGNVQAQREEAQALAERIAAEREEEARGSIEPEPEVEAEG